MTEIKPIRIVVVDDHALFREMLTTSLALQPDFVIAGEFASVEEAMELIRKESVDLVLLDINLGVEQGSSFLPRAQASGFRGKVLVVTAGVSNREAAWLLHRGCSGIFLKNDPPAVLFQRIRDVMSGSSKMDPVSIRSVLSEIESQDRAIRKRLTPRESEVLRYVCEGLSNKEIAQRLEGSENTVKGLLQQLFAKAGVRSRAQLVRVAIECYWDQVEPRLPSPSGPSLDGTHGAGHTPGQHRDRSDR
jgi:two-component system nitrate/nitrite response regulator NarL